MNKVKIGLALGGGGVRGLAHIGVLKVLEQEGIPVGYITGTSMGAIIGGAYAVLGRAAHVEEKVLTLLRRKEIKQLESLAGKSAPEDKKIIVQGLVGFIQKSRLWNFKKIKHWIVNGSAIEALIEQLIENAEFSQTKIPFSCVACDLKTGEEIILNKGGMSGQIMASCSLPGVFPPVKMKKRLLIDGGTVSRVPIEAVRKSGAGFVLAINVQPKVYCNTFASGIDTLFQSDEIIADKLMRLKLQQADFVISPKVEKFSWAAFSQADRCIKEGEKAAARALVRLKSVLGRKRRRR